MGSPQKYNIYIIPLWAQAQINQCLQKCVTTCDTECVDNLYEKQFS